MRKAHALLVSAAIFGAATLPTLAADDSTMRSVAGVRAFPSETGGPMTPVDGTSVLWRSDEGVAFTFDTRGLEPGAAYTAWWVAFNAPENCATPYECMSADLDVAATKPGMISASGRVADVHGQATFAGLLDYGVTPEGEGLVPNPKRANAIEENAEIHLVLRWHGEAASDAAVLEAQLTEFNGGCPDDGCVNAQASIHTSPEAPSTSADM